MFGRFAAIVAARDEVNHDITPFIYPLYTLYTPLLPYVHLYALCYTCILFTIYTLYTPFVHLTPQHPKYALSLPKVNHEWVIFAVPPGEGSNLRLKVCY